MLVWLFCKVFKWVFNHWFFVSTKKNFINHNSPRTTTNEWWAINAIWFVVERILATFFESLLHQNHVNEVFSTRENCKLKYQYRCVSSLFLEHFIFLLFYFRNQDLSFFLISLFLILEKILKSFFEFTLIVRIYKSLVWNMKRFLFWNHALR